MSLTLHDLPDDVAVALKTLAAADGKTVEAVAEQVLRRGLHLADAAATSTRVRDDDLSQFAGTWVEDPEFDKIMAEMDVIDPEMWR